MVVHTFRLGADAAYVATGVFDPGDTITVAGLDWISIPVDDPRGED